jgi:very-short-patch-repair endonuclease
MGGVTPQENPSRHGEGDHAKRGGGGSRQTHRPETYLARKLRREMTLPEVLLWQRLNGAQSGLRFRKQHPVGPYVADFYCSATRTVVEVDGEAHNRGDRPERDIERDTFLTQNGYRVIHIMASEILRNADEAAASVAVLAASPLHPDAARRGPPPLAGEDF